MCKKCRFWYPRFDSERVQGLKGRLPSLGECRRFPPQIPHPQKQDGYFPLVGFEQWCGEFMLAGNPLAENKSKPEAE